MTEAGWTRPKEVNQAGWYWLRRVGSLAVVEVIAVPGYEPKHWIVEGVNLRWSLGNMDGEWLGPITPDSYRQGRVEGLREASKKASDAVPLLFGTHPNFANYIADALMDFSDILNEDADKLAQAAQDEKGVGDGN